MILSCIIIDDEPLARKGLKEYIADTGFLYLKGEFENPVKAMEVMNGMNIDLIFLDIQMPRLSGIEFLNVLPHPPLVIITTAYPQYAVEGFEYNAVDYLVKPFSFERFYKAAVRARAMLLQQEAKNSSGEYFFIKSDNKLIKIAYDEILFIEALQNYIAVHTKDHKYISYLTFKSVESNLPVEHFLKIHKSYIVALRYVESIEGNLVKIGKNLLPIGRSYKEEVMKRLLDGHLFKR